MRSHDPTWRKLGLVYEARPRDEWMVSHGANPVAGETSGDVVRVYFSCRDAQQRSSVAWVDVDFSDPLHPLAGAVSPSPLLSPGELGAFDDSGISLGCLVFTDTGAYLYYLGWNLAVTVPWRNAIGLAIRRPGSESFERFSPAPILDRSREDPLSLSYPWVLREGDLWRMWYGSNRRWGGATQFDYVLHYAESRDGLSWRPRLEGVSLETYPGEYAPARPCVRYTGDALDMWYSSRGEAFRIFHASSSDGLAWTREPKTPVVEVSDRGWDSEMTCYPSVFEHKSRLYMLYNGNGYGRDGFGIAVLER